MNPQNYNVLSDFWIPLFSAAEKNSCSPSLNVLGCFSHWFATADESVFEIWIELTLIPTMTSNVPIQPSADRGNSEKKTIMTSDGVVLLTGCSISRNPDSLMSDRCIFSLQLRLYWFSLAFRLFKCALFVYMEKKLFFKSIIFYYWQGFGFLSVWNNQRNLLRMRALASRANCLRSSQQETRISRFANVNVNYKTKLEELDWNAS